MMKAVGKTGSSKLRVWSSVGTVLFWLVNTCALCILLTPMIVVVASSFSKSAYQFFPPVGFSLRWYHAFFNSHEFTSALRSSLILAVFNCLLALALGIPVSVAIVRYQIKGKGILSTLFLTPMVFPAIVLGIALLIYFSRIGLYATFSGLVLGQLVVTTPYAIRSISSVLYGISPSVEEAAISLGANRLYTLMTITLPLAKPGVIAGGIFAFIISFDELVISIFIAGPRVSTLPIRIYSYLEYSLDPTVAAIASIVILVLAVLLTICPGKWLTVVGRGQVGSAR